MTTYHSESVKYESMSILLCFIQIFIENAKRNKLKPLGTMAVRVMAREKPRPCYWQAFPRASEEQAKTYIGAGACIKKKLSVQEHIMAAGVFCLHS